MVGTRPILRPARRAGAAHAQLGDGRDELRFGLHGQIPYFIASMAASTSARPRPDRRRTAATAVPGRAARPTPAVLVVRQRGRPPSSAAPRARSAAAAPPPPAIAPKGHGVPPAAAGGNQTIASSNQKSLTTPAAADHPGQLGRQQRRPTGGEILIPAAGHDQPDFGKRPRTPGSRRGEDGLGPAPQGDLPGQFRPLGRHGTGDRHVERRGVQVFEVLPDRPAGQGMDHVAAHQGRRLQHESPPGHARVRQHQAPASGARPDRTTTDRDRSAAVPSAPARRRPRPASISCKSSRAPRAAATSPRPRRR